MKQRLQKAIFVVAVIYCLLLLLIPAPEPKQKAADYKQEPPRYLCMRKGPCKMKEYDRASQTDSRDDRR